jgi:hypothetical protein
MTENKITCDSCDKEVVNAWDLDRWGDCKACKVKGQEMDMSVGDRHTK